MIESQPQKKVYLTRYNHMVMFGLVHQSTEQHVLPRNLASQKVEKKT